MKLIVTTGVQLLMDSEDSNVG